VVSQTPNPADSTGALGLPPVSGRGIAAKVTADKFTARLEAQLVDPGASPFKPLSKITPSKIVWSEDAALATLEVTLAGPTPINGAKLRMIAGPAGEITLELPNGVINVLTQMGSVNVSAPMGSVSVSALNAVISALASANVSAPVINAVAASMASLTAPLVSISGGVVSLNAAAALSLVAPAIALGPTPQGGIYAGVDLLIWALTHMHPFVGPGGLTFPSAVPLNPSVMRPNIMA
jgi:hypothetical protein